MPKYRNKPVEVEAIQWTGCNAAVEALVRKGYVARARRGRFNKLTLYTHDNIPAIPIDHWLVRTKCCSSGYAYYEVMCSAEFHATYELIEPVTEAE